MHLYVGIMKRQASKMLAIWGLHAADSDGSWSAKGKQAGWYASRVRAR